MRQSKKYFCRQLLAVISHLTIDSFPLSCFLVRVPCRSGLCTTPLQVTSGQLIASEIFPLPVVKALLYPGAVLDGVINNKTVPNWDNILNIYNLTGVKEASAATELHRLEVGAFPLNMFLSLF